MTSEEKSKRIGKYLIQFFRFVKDTWTSAGMRKTDFYEISINLNQRGALIEKGFYDDGAAALKAYRGLKTASDVHKYLNHLNPSDRPMRTYDRRLTYNR
ncbi:MAG: hypothetical protein V1715_04395 [bacterium]